MTVIDPYATGVLQAAHHERLVADLPNIAQAAAIQPHWIWTPLADTVGESEVEWVKGFRAHSQTKMSGLCLTGNASAAVAATHMAAIAGALIRNYINARVMTTAALFDKSEQDGVPDPTCLLVPNFFVGKSIGQPLAPWRIDMLQNVLFERHMAGRQTVVYVSKLDDCSAEYGDVMTQIFKLHYYVVPLTS